MSIPGIHSLLNALEKGGLSLPRPHGMDWPQNHPLHHEGGAKGFPLGVGKPHHPLGGSPGQNRPDAPQTGSPPGIDRPTLHPPGIDRPPAVPGTLPGPRQQLPNPGPPPAP